jgi:hypothetical protein
VVPERDHVGPGGEDAGGELRRDPDPVGQVLPVDDAEVDPELVAEAGQPLFDRTPAGRSYDVGEEEELQRSDRTAAGRTDRDTLFPASCV